MSVLDISLSRYHAELRLDVATSTWLLRDLGSTNGTWCGGERITTPLPLVSSTAIWFAQVGFYFVSPAATEEQSDESLLVETQIGRGEGPGREDLDPEEGERTHPGLPAMQLELFEPVGGGGGFLVLDGQRVQLSASQFELLRALARRMYEQSEQPEIVRGFVRSSELISDLPWDTAHPGDNHLKQLVRRLRRTLGMFDLGHIIESRQGLGYRLRIRPLTTPTPE